MHISLIQAPFDVIAEYNPQVFINISSKQPFFYMLLSLDDFFFPSSKSMFYLYNIFSLTISNP